MGRLQAPGGVNAEASSREDRLWEWACNPGRAGRSRQGRLCRERVGGIAGGLAQAQAGVPAGGPGHHAWDICPAGGGSSPPVPSTLSSSKFSTLTFSSCPVRLAVGTGGE